MKRSTSAITALAIFHATIALVACEDEVINGNSAPPPPRRAIAAASSSASGLAAASATAPPLTEAEFTRTDANRDPFFPYADAIKPPVDPKKFRTQALADQFSLDELKLVGIVTGNTAARAMFTDPQGKGWIVGLGQLLGRAETVRAGGNQGAEYELNWKVDRIRENDVVFIRETPGRANIPNATRVVTLRTSDDKSR